MHRANNDKSSITGAAVSVVAAVLFVGLFWGFGWLTHWDTRFFSTGSDDLVKDVYTTTYHAAYDDSMTMSHAMNYPYGEYYTFTGMQPLVAAPLQWLRTAGVPHTERAVLPLMNLLSLLSIVLCCLFLFLLLQELKLPTWYAVVGALLITMMSPQLQRLGAHMSLSYYCAIPMLLYLTLRHLRSGAWGWAVANGSAMLLFGLCHPYYIVFYVVILGGEAVYLAVRHDRLPWNGSRPWLRIAVSVLLQLVIPLSLFYLFTHVGLPDGERTAIPSGFRAYRGRIEGILFPYGRLYFFEESRLFANVQWEARNYVGVVAVVAIVLVLCHFFRCLAKKQFANALRPTDSRELNLMLLLATLLLLYSCGVPFSWMPRNIVSYIGPLAQFRAQGRFVWLFCYVINIVALYGLYRWWQAPPSAKRRWIMIAALAVMAAEGTAYNWHNKAWYTCSWDEWTDYDNRLPQNKWLHDFDASRYQAILTLPVFNAGSEMVYLPSQDRMFQRSALLSMKTGLPLVCHESARSDVRQAWDCVALSRTAWQPLALACNLPSDKPLLLAVTKNRVILSDAERKILSLADSVSDLGDMELYSLDCDAFSKVTTMTCHELESLYDSIASFPPDRRITCIPDTLCGDIHRWNTLFDGDISASGDVEISFWMSDIFKDAFTRSTFKVEAISPDGRSTQLHSWSGDISLDIVDIEREEGLFRIPVTVPDGCSHLRVTARCHESRPSPVCFHHLLIRPADIHVASTSMPPRIDNIPLYEKNLE